MNDEMSGQLTQHWTIPPAAQQMLYIQGAGGTFPIEGEYGLFTLDVPSSVITLYWGGEDGTALVRLRWQPDNLDWDGSVCVGGYIDAIHFNYSGAILYLGGHPLLVDAPAKTANYTKPVFNHGLATDLKESCTTWFLPPESPLMSTVQLALAHNLRVHFMGHLADHGSPWWQIMTLPLLLQGVMVFSS
ncbi:MAG: hypothetical protein CUN56_08150 [Phototrophicales bacterium]|nr:MAG: hypothetical protein CUN56_08150 [Phototrophicales bacterium]